jgi:hypothetical protein
MDLLQPLAAERGMRLMPQRGTFSATTYLFKVEFAEIGEDGIVETGEAQAFRLMASLYGLQPEWLGREFLHGGRTFKVTGLNAKAKRMPVTAESEGREYKFAAPAVAKALEGK